MIQKGDAWSRHSFGTVVDVTKTAVTVRNEIGKEWQVGPDLFADEFRTASLSNFDNVVKLSRTDLIRKFEEVSHQAVCVNFNKKLDTKALLTELRGAKDKATVLRLLEAKIDGEETTMLGYHMGSRDDFGRIHFTKLGEGQRLVDPRTINWFTTAGVRYVVK